MLLPRELLIYFAVKHNGEWHKIYEEARKKNNSSFTFEEVRNVVDNLKSKAITVFDKEYPEVLKSVYCPPLVLFYQGDISLLSDENLKLSVVGSREYGEYAKESTEKIISELPMNVTIVSGLAIGIDTIAHTAAINSNKRTIAILGCGINLCYTSSNRDIYEEIKKKHLVISEYPDIVEPKPENFPFRNRIIACLGHNLLVSQISLPSGTLHTVNYALGLGRTILCIPHSPLENSRCNQLIRDGAVLVESGEDVLEELKKKF